MPVYHPRHDDAGKPVILDKPSAPSPLACWEDPKAIARVVPDGSLPERLNGLALVPCYSGELPAPDEAKEAAEATQAQAPRYGIDSLSHGLEAPPLTLSPGISGAGGYRCLRRGKRAMCRCRIRR